MNATPNDFYIQKNKRTGAKLRCNVSVNNIVFETHSILKWLARIILVIKVFLCSNNYL